MHVEHVLAVDDPLPDGHGQALVAPARVAHAVVVSLAEVGLDQALKLEIDIILY